MRACNKADEILERFPGFSWFKDNIFLRLRGSNQKGIGQPWIETN